MTCTCNAKIYQQKCFQLWIMIVPVLNVYLNLPPLFKVCAFIQKNGKYIYHLVGGMIPNFLRTCFSWDSIKLFSDGTLFLPLRFVLMTKTLPRKRSWTPKKGRSVWQQTPQSFWRSASELVGHDEQRHPIQPHHTTGVIKHDRPRDLSCTRSNDHLLPPPRPTRQSYAPVRTINWKALTATTLASNKHPESCFQRHFTTGEFEKP